MKVFVIISMKEVFIMKKKVVSIILIIIMLMSVLPLNAAATSSRASNIRVILDGRTLSFDVPPMVINNRTMVPMRAIFEALGATVDWNSRTQTATGTRAGTVVVLTIGSRSPTVNGRVVPIDQPGVVVSGRTMVPLRFVSEAFGVNVDWNASTQTVTITRPGAPTHPTPTPTPTPAFKEGLYINHKHAETGGNPGYYPTLEILPNNRYRFTENFYEGLATITGTYTFSGPIVALNVPSDSVGFFGRTLEFHARGNDLIFVSPNLSMTLNGDIFRFDG